MSLILIPSEQANVTQISTDQTSIVTSAQATVTNLTTQKIPDVQSKEATNLKVFNYQHAICASYDLEIGALNGVVVTTPLVEQDIIDRSNFTGRLFDGTLVNKDIVRIAEMDGGNTVVVPSSACQLSELNGFDGIEDRLDQGLLTSVALSHSVTSVITPASLNFTVSLNVSALAGKEFIVSGSGLSFIGLCSTVTNVLTVYTVNFTFVSTFTGSISLGLFTGTWNGFTNLERTNKVSTGGYQTVMNYYIARLSASVTAHIGFLNSQVSALMGNGDPALPPSALVNAQADLPNYQNYLNTLLITDAGFTTLNNYAAASLTTINSRISAITAARVPFYNKRYFWAVERAGANGTLIQLALLNQAVTAAQARNTVATAKLATIQAGVL